MSQRILGKALTYVLLVTFILSFNLRILPLSFETTEPRPPLPATREPIRGRHAMVASQHELASKIGIDILKKGGNAVDAAIAVGLALAVVYPEAGNIGGGGFMLHRRSDGQVFAIDYREMAPKAATRDVFVDKDGNRISGVRRTGNARGFRSRV
jgi:gamma-glutamyltranspeptidase/glutathione hydrolase